jgi:hypothetical protein
MVPNRMPTTEETTAIFVSLDFYFEVDYDDRYAKR